MPDPVNLNRVRKQKARAEAKARADRNAVLHGLPKAERQRAKTEAEAARRKLDGRLRDGASQDDE